MKSRIVLLFAICFATCGTVFCESTNPVGNLKAEVWRYDGLSEQTNNAGTVFMALQFFDPTAKWTVDIISYRYYTPVPTAEGRIGLPADQRLVDTIKTLKKGDLFLTYETTNNVLVKVEKYAARPGEDSADTYALLRTDVMKVNDVDFPAVVLKKFLKEATYPIGNTNAVGKWVASPELLATAKRFEAGGMVKVAFEPEEKNVLRRGMQYFVTGIRQGGEEAQATPGFPGLTLKDLGNDAFLISDGFPYNKEFGMVSHITLSVGNSGDLDKIAFSHVLVAEGEDKTGRFKAIPANSGRNITWKFTEANTSFRIGDYVYTSLRKDADIEFTDEGVILHGFRITPVKVFRKSK